MKSLYCGIPLTVIGIDINLGGRIPVGSPQILPLNLSGRTARIADSSLLVTSVPIAFKPYPKAAYLTSFQGFIIADSAMIGIIR